MIVLFQNVESMLKLAGAGADDSIVKELAAQALTFQVCVSTVYHYDCWKPELAFIFFHPFCAFTFGFVIIFVVVVVVVVVAGHAVLLHCLVLRCGQQARRSICRFGTGP